MFAEVIDQFITYFDKLLGLKRCNAFPIIFNKAPSMNAR